LTTHKWKLAQPGRTVIAGAPEGYDAVVLARFVQAMPAGRTPAGEVLHVCRDDTRLALLVASLGFFAPEIEVLQFPAWDCLPYDRVSPHRDIVGRRVETLTRLLEARLPEKREREPKRRLVATTVSALLQRLPSRAFFTNCLLTLKRGHSVAREDLVGFLSRNGYQRVETVSEAGEFALRGDIVDLFPSGAAAPVRVDFFGDEIERMRGFDPLSQRGTGDLGELRLAPVGEVRLDPAAIERFRSGYREGFGGGGTDDPLYASISAGQAHAGMEHWLPLFHERLETLLDYLPGAAIVLDHQCEEVRDGRLEMIADFHRARVEFQRAGAEEGGVYRPLPAEALYLDGPEWERLLGKRAVAALTPFAVPDATALDAGGRQGNDFSAVRVQTPGRLFDETIERLRTEQKAGRRAIVAAFSLGSLDRLSHLLGDHGLERRASVASWHQAKDLAPAAVAFAVLPIESGFIAADLAVITEQDILGDRLARPARPTKRPEQFLAELANFAAGDFVVHADHGVGRYEGLETLDVGGGPHDCLRLVYDGGDKLYVPVENIDGLSRYGSADAGAVLDRLGGVAWQSRKARVKERLREIAGQLIRTAAVRALRNGEAMTPPDGLYEEFCARFPYAETEDQTRAILDVLADMASGRPMDRLICGDVGFGKTEVALRAAFVAALSGHQVAVVTPTTLLCRQHALTFGQRFAGLPVRIGQISRLATARQVSDTKAALKEGKLDIVIGTHALLAKSVEFANLGLVIVDEEQHFGVTQKERLKELRAEVHVLTLTATPIPRTLQLALAGVREMSLIATPPVDRLAVRTFVLPWDPVVVREAILREQHRGGQVFCVCPRIEDLPRMAERLQALVPAVKFAIAHGQMPPRELEKTMLAFYDGTYRMLLATNIIESGLDVPTANTLIIHRAEMFGLSQLYQLRGRIGRSKMRGYAYLTVPPGRILTEAAGKRLKVMQTLDQLGAGFTLASHDLDIRGAGNLLGEEQSGHLREVGVELYQHMLEEAVGQLRGQAPVAEEWAPTIGIGMPVLIPESYVADLGVRLGLYRRLARLLDAAESEAFAVELVDRFGPLPEEVENLLQVIAIKRFCRAAGVEKVEAGPKGAVIAFRKNRFAKPEHLIRFIQGHADEISLRPDHRLVYRQDWAAARKRIVGVLKLMRMLAEMAT